MTPQSPITVLVCAGAPKPDLDSLKNIYQSSDQAYLIGVDYGCLSILKTGLKLNYAVGDFDSVSPEECLQIQAASDRFEQLIPEKDNTDTEMALYHIKKLIEEGYEIEAIYLLGCLGPGGRLDHTIANLWMALHPDFKDLFEQIIFLERACQVQVFQPGNYRLTDRLDSDYLSIIALTPIKDWIIEGAKYNLSQSEWTYPRALISNEFVNPKDIVTLSFSQGLVAVLWIREQAQAKD